MLQGCCMSEACKRLGEQEYAACTIADVFTILYHGAIAFATPFAGFTQQLQRLFVHADNGKVLVIRTAVDFQHVLHAGCKVRALLLGNAPFLDQMRFQVILPQDFSNRSVAYAIYVIHPDHSFRQKSQRPFAVTFRRCMTGECYQVGFHVARYLPFDRRGVGFWIYPKLCTAHRWHILHWHYYRGAVKHGHVL